VVVFDGSLESYAFVALIVVGGFQRLDLLAEEFFRLTYFCINNGCDGFWSGSFFGGEERECIVGTVFETLFCENAS
jgi:hypothetical protein